VIVTLKRKQRKAITSICDLNQTAIDGKMKKVVMFQNKKFIYDEKKKKF